jgi:hypothetical protein
MRSLQYNNEHYAARGACLSVMCGVRRNVGIGDVLVDDDLNLIERLRGIEGGADTVTLYEASSAPPLAFQVGACGRTSACIVGNGPECAPDKRNRIVEQNRVARRFVGSSGIEVSAIGLGCMSLSGTYGASDDNEGIAVIQEALDQGITFLDSSDMYGWGHNEELIGRAIKGLAGGPCHQIRLAAERDAHARNRSAVRRFLKTYRHRRGASDSAIKVTCGARPWLRLDSPPSWP